MKALFVSTHFPRDATQSTTGTFRRMRTFLDALKEKASIRLLFYHRPELQLDAKGVGRTLKSQWQIDDLEVVLCPQHLEPSHGTRLWDGYLVRTLSMHRQLGFVRTSGPAQVRAFEECLHDRPDVVFAHRLNSMCPMLMTRCELPPVFMDLDDIEHKVFLHEISHPPKWFAKRLMYLQWPALVWGERRAIKLSTKTFVCSVVDAQYLIRTWGLANVRVIPNSVPIPKNGSLTQEPVLMFIGVYSYRPNAIAAEHLITRIWPLIREACPDARLIIAGAGPESISCFGQDHPGVEYTGFVNDLDALYRRTRVVCCPIQSGGGTRIKIIEAAAYAKPVVSTHIGAEGLDFEDGREILLHDDAKAFADACLELIRNDALCGSIGAAARIKAMELYDRGNVIRQIQNQVFGSLNSSHMAR